MNIGSLYLVKKWSWLLFPTKETATATAVAAAARAHANDPFRPATAFALLDDAAYWSRRYNYSNCEVTYFSPETLVVFLEEDGALKKVLTSDGKIGWSLFSDHYNDCFEEVKTEQ